MVPRTRTVGIVLGFITAVISGVSVFVNGYGTKHFKDATVYTTTKNLVAAVLLAALAFGAARLRTSGEERVPFTSRDRWGFLAVGIIGGAVPFVLFFEGLQRAGSTDAAFLQKTLVVWVALLAVPLLHERLNARSRRRDRTADRRAGEAHQRLALAASGRGVDPDPRGDAVLGGRGRDSQAAPPAAIGTDARYRADEHRCGRARSPGSRSPAVFTSSPVSAPTRGDGPCSPVCSCARTWRVGTRPSPAPKPLTSLQFSSEERSSPRH